MKTIIIDIVTHKGLQVVVIKFPIDTELGNAVRKIKNIRWSNTQKAWYAPYSIPLLNEIKTVFDSISKIDAQPLKDKLAQQKNNARSFKENDLNIEEINNIEKFKSWMQSRRYSDNTIGTYTNALQSFLKFYHNKPIKEITNDDVIKYNNEFILKNKLSASYQNQVVNVQI